MADSVQNYLNTKYKSSGTGESLQNTRDYGLETFFGQLLTPFRIGQETLTATLIDWQSSNLDWNEAHKIAVGNRAGKEWWEDGSDKVSTLGQAVYDFFSPNKVDYTKLTKEQQDKRFASGPAKYVSGGIDFVGNFLLDPLNYVGVGLGVAAWKGLRNPEAFSKAILSGKTFSGPFISGGNEGKVRATAKLNDIITSDAFDDPIEYHKAAIARMHELGNKTARIGSDAYSQTINSIKPMFSSYQTSNFRAPKLPGDDGTVAYFDTGVYPYAIKDDVLHRFEIGSEENSGNWVAEIAIDAKDLTNLFSNHFTPEGKMNDIGNFFTKLEQDASIWSIPLADGTSLNFTEGSFIGTFSDDADKLYTVLAVPNEADQELSYYALSHVPIERQPIDETAYTQRELSLLDEQITEWETLQFAWDKSKFFDPKEVSFDDAGSGLASDFIPLESFDSGMLLPVGKRTEAYPINDGMSIKEKRVALNKYIDSIINSKKRKNNQNFNRYSYLVIPQANGTNVLYEAVRTPNKYTFFNKVTFTRDVDNTVQVSLVKIEQPKIEAAKLNFGDDLEPVNPQNIEQALARIKRLSEFEDTSVPIDGPKQAPTLSKEEAANLEKMMLEEKQMRDLMSSDISPDVEDGAIVEESKSLSDAVYSEDDIWTSAVNDAKKYYSEILGEDDLDLGDYGTRLVKLNPSEIASLTKARISYSDIFGQKRVGRVPFNFIKTKNTVRVGSLETGIPIFRNEKGEYYSFGLENEFMPLNKVQNYVSKYRKYARLAHNAIGSIAISNKKAMLKRNQDLFDIASANPLEHMLRLVSALDRAKARKTASGLSQAALNAATKEVNILEERIQKVLDVMDPEFLNSELAKLRTDPDFVPRYTYAASRQKALESRKPFDIEIYKLNSKIDKINNKILEMKNQVPNEYDFYEGMSVDMDNADQAMAKSQAFIDRSIKKLNAAKEKAVLKKQALENERDSIIVLPLRGDAQEAYSAIESLQTQIALAANVDYRDLNTYRKMNATNEYLLEDIRRESGFEPLYTRDEELMDDIEQIEKGYHESRIQSIAENYENEGRRPIYAELGAQFDFDGDRLSVEIIMRDTHMSGFDADARTLFSREAPILRWEFTAEDFPAIKQWASPQWNSTTDRDRYLFNLNQRIYPNILSNKNGQYLLNSFVRDHIGIEESVVTKAGSTEALTQYPKTWAMYDEVTKDLIRIDPETGVVIPAEEAFAAAEVTERIFPIRIQIDELNLIGEPRWDEFRFLTPIRYNRENSRQVSKLLDGYLKKAAGEDGVSTGLSSKEEDLVQLLKYIKQTDPLDIRLSSAEKQERDYLYALEMAGLGMDELKLAPPIGAYKEKVLVQMINDMLSNPAWSSKLVLRNKFITDDFDFRSFAKTIAEDKEIIKHVEAQRILDEEATLRGEQGRVKDAADEEDFISRRTAFFRKIREERTEELKRKLAEREAQFPTPSELSTVEPSTISNVVIHSGGAAGADSLFAEIANEIGLPTKAYSFKGHTIEEGSPEYIAGFKGARPAKEERVVLTDEELFTNVDEMSRAGSNIHYDNGKYLPTGKKVTKNKLILRNFYQVNNSDAVIAVGKFAAQPNTDFRLNVNGGTGWAVELGILQGKQVYFYSVGNKKWAKFNYETNNWEAIEGLPPKFNNFAGIGSREVGDVGEQAIRDYLMQFKEANAIKSSATEVVTRASNPNAVKEVVDAGGVYIGRKSSTYDYPGFYGNPYVVQNGKVKEAVDAYREDLISVLNGTPSAESEVVKYYKDKFKVDVSTEEGRQRLIERIKQLDGKRIVCAGTEPANECHGNVLVEVLEMIKNGEIK